MKSTYQFKNFSTKETEIQGINPIRTSWKDVQLIPSGLFWPDTLSTIFPVGLR
ncbi:MAG TPA: hypothetical protein VK957_05170 [Lunatimonas sp.]|nr:hypothetical protein [Lunatimonas sp.]